MGWLRAGFVGVVMGISAASIACVGNSETLFSTGGDTSSTSGTSPACQAGRVASCSCQGGGAGTQTCSANGTWGTCQGCGGEGGTGGAGGSTSSASTGGGATGGASSSSASSGGGSPCSVDGDCPGYPGPTCDPVSCVFGTCMSVAAPLGDPTPDTMPGDCMSPICNGMGGETELLNINDIPDDGNDCTNDLCSPQGQPSHTNVAKGVACSTNGGKFCNGGGQCVECLSDVDCKALKACSSYVDQVSCQMQKGCMWDGFNSICKGMALGTCQNDACLP